MLVSPTADQKLVCYQVTLSIPRCCCLRCGAVSGGEEPPVDESGNPVLRDIGTALKKAIKGAIPDADVKYIDPTYMVQVRQNPP